MGDTAITKTTTAKPGERARPGERNRNGDHGRAAGDDGRARQQRHTG